MSDNTRREFAELALDGSNYLTWALDVDILASFDLSATINHASQSTLAQKAKALIFPRHHLNKDLKNEYLTEKNPANLWKSLKDRFDQQTAIILPQAQYDWLNIRFQDFKSVTEYNSALHRIVSQLKLCKQNITEAELLEKTLSTFHASNLVLQQQYRAKNYATYSELISALLVAEKHNQLLMKNHNARPVGTQAVPEAHATTHGHHNVRGRGRGYHNQSPCGGRGRSRGRGHGRGRVWTRDGGRGHGDNVLGGRSENLNIEVDHLNRRDSHLQPKEQKQVCFRCGCDSHWSRTCRTPRHLIEAYQRMLKDKKGKAPQGESHHASLPEANLAFNADDDDLLKLELEDYGDDV